MDHGDKMMKMFEHLQGMMAELHSGKAGTSSNVPCDPDNTSIVESLSQSSSESDSGVGKFNITRT